MNEIVISGAAIYFNEKEQIYCVRGFLATLGKFEPQKEIGTTTTLNDARKLIPKTMKIRLDRKETDDKTIVETWM